MTAPVIFQVDASDYSLGAALLQPSKHHNSSTLDESCLQPVAYSSKSSTPTKQHYMQIEKECLTIVEAFNKFDQWLLGKSDVTVHTDHQPLQSIFQKDLASAPKCLQKMILFPQRYNFTVAYRKVSLLHLDDTREQLCRATASCQEMQSLAHYIFHGWPPTKDQLPQQLQAFWHFQEELSIADGILLKATWAILPPSLRPSMLTNLPRSINHIGVLNTAFVLLVMLFSSPACPRTLKNSATPAQLSSSTVSKQLQSQLYRILFQLFHGSLSPKTYLRSGTNST